MVIGLGGAGGVAVEPLAAASLNVIGLEARTRLGSLDFAPDELRSNHRGWPQAAQKVMGTSGVRNPTLTAQALAWRATEQLVANWSAIAA